MNRGGQWRDRRGESGPCVLSQSRARSSMAWAAVGQRHAMPARAGAESESVERVDGERAVAALRATGTAGEPGTGTLGSLGEEPGPECGTNWLSRIWTWSASLAEMPFTARIAEFGCGQTARGDGRKTFRMAVISMEYFS